MRGSGSRVGLIATNMRPVVGSLRTKSGKEISKRTFELFCCACAVKRQDRPKTPPVRAPSRPKNRLRFISVLHLLYLWHFLVDRSYALLLCVTGGCSVRKRRIDDTVLQVLIKKIEHIKT